MFGYGRVKELEKENTKLRDDLRAANELIASINSSITSATPFIDFDSMRVFSIERLVDNNRPTTVLGYWKEEPVVADGEVVGKKDKLHQWYLFCNNERHEEIVTQFKQWKESK